MDEFNSQKGELNRNLFASDKLKMSILKKLKGYSFEKYHNLSEHGLKSILDKADFSFSSLLGSERYYSSVL